MRDPKRITRIMDKLQQLWLTHPDLRLGQLIENLALSTVVLRDDVDQWNLEDDKMEAAIDEILANGWNGRSLR